MIKTYVLCGLCSSGIYLSIYNHVCVCVSACVELISPHKVGWTSPEIALLLWIFCGMITVGENEELGKRSEKDWTSPPTLGLRTALSLWKRRRPLKPLCTNRQETKPTVASPLTVSKQKAITFLTGALFFSEIWEMFWDLRNPVFSGKSLKYINSKLYFKEFKIF